MNAGPVSTPSMQAIMVETSLSSFNRSPAQLVAPLNRLQPPEPAARSGAGVEDQVRLRSAGATAATGVPPRCVSFQ